MCFDLCSLVAGNGLVKAVRFSLNKLNRPLRFWLCCFTLFSLRPLLYAHCFLIVKASLCQRLSFKLTSLKSIRDQVILQSGKIRTLNETRLESMEADISFLKETLKYIKVLSILNLNSTFAIAWVTAFVVPIPVLAVNDGYG